MSQPSNEFQPHALHVVPGNGGGVDRYVRDICAIRRQDLIAHVGSKQVVIERCANATYALIEDPALDTGSIVAAVGAPWLLHAHSSVPEVRALVQRLRASVANLTYVVTLHDVMFADATLSASERSARAQFITGASAVIAPSGFISELAGAELSLASDVRVIEPGFANSLAEPANALAPRGGSKVFPIAVVGALGTHKGLQFLVDVAEQLPPTHPIVLIGYTDGQLGSGWLVKDKIWVHGAFQPAQTKAILDAYGSSIVFFPNRQAEGYSYTLSDVWISARPALVPDLGALGQRVSTTGAGWTYAINSTAQSVARQLLDCLNNAADIEARNARAACAASELPTIAQFVEKLVQLYAEAPFPSAGVIDESVFQSLPSTHLDASLFRSELVRMDGDLRFERGQRERLAKEFASVNEEFAARGLWIEKLDADLQTNQRALAAQTGALLAAQRAHASDVTKLTEDVRQTLQVAHRFERALNALPRLVRQWALRRADQFDKKQRDD